MACTTTDLYKSVLKCPGTKVAPGIKAFVYYLLKSQIVKWPTLPDTIDTAKDDMSKLATYDGDFTLAADAKWKRLDLVDLKSNITSETQGEAPSATVLNKGELIVGGTDAEISGFARLAINDPLVMLVPERGGKFRVIGCEDFDPKVTVAQASGTAVTDAKQTTVSVEATDYCPSPFYTGKIETADNGDISGADGSAVTE